jgi:hypothetical protein
VHLWCFYADLFQRDHYHRFTKAQHTRHKAQHRDCTIAAVLTQTLYKRLCDVFIHSAPLVYLLLLNTTPGEYTQSKSQPLTLDSLSRANTPPSKALTARLKGLPWGLLAAGMPRFSPALQTAVA